MNMNLSSSQKVRPRRLLSGLFGSKERRPLPSFLNERVLRDIGLLEPAAPARHEARTEAFSEPAIRHHVFSIGLNGL